MFGFIRLLFAVGVEFVWFGIEGCLLGGYVFTCLICSVWICVITLALVWVVIDGFAVIFCWVFGLGNALMFFDGFACYWVYFVLAVFSRALFVALMLLLCLGLLV